MRAADAVRRAVEKRIRREPLLQLEYVSVAGEETLEELEGIDRPALLLVAARAGSTRLIDNAVLIPKGMETPERLRALLDA